MSKTVKQAKKTVTRKARPAAAGSEGGRGKGREPRGKEPRLSRLQMPDGASPEQWQLALRRQFGRDQVFGMENLGAEPFFSEFRVSNPQSKMVYRVEVRGQRPGDNRCTCLDFATNELGSCKHIEFVLGQLEKKRGAKAAFRRGYAPSFSELVLLNAGQRQVQLRLGEDCPRAIRDVASRLFDPERGWRLRQERYEDLERFISLTRKAGHELRAADEVLDFIAGRRDARRRSELLDHLIPAGAADPALQKLVRVPMYPYQADGVLFAARAGRALIGDEMGLGKTIQAVAAAELLIRHFGVSKVLVICPTSLKYQWQSEIARFVDREARVISGGRAARPLEYAQEDVYKITNFEKIQPDLDLISDWGPELVIVDEAQRVKNWNTIAARALKRIDSPYAFVLTGTPLENKLEELISIVQFIDQHRLGPTWKLLHEHQVRDEHGKVIGYTGLEKVGKTLAPVLIRRKKSEVLRQLPERTDQNLLVPMTGPQLVYHQENADIVAKIVHRWRQTKHLSEQDQRRLTCALQNMRMSCDSTYLLDQASDHGVKADELGDLLEGMLTQPDAKAVVFSQWTRAQETVIRRLDARGIGYVFLHGGIASKRRPELVARFHDDPACRVFLSTDAGAFGLNLQRASFLVNLDLPWNPALLEQRIGRIYRLGQKRPVRIINFVAKGTIEEGMLSVLAFKRSLSAGILDGGLGEISLGGSRLNRFLKEVEQVTGRIGAGEAMTAAEELAEALHAPALETTLDVSAAGPQAEASEPKAAPAVESEVGDPWRALAQAGAALLAALAAPDDSRAHPWVERDANTGVKTLRVPLPPPEVMKPLADALVSWVDGLRGG